MKSHAVKDREPLENYMKGIYFVEQIKNLDIVEHVKIEKKVCVGTTIESNQNEIRSNAGKFKRSCSEMVKVRGFKKVAQEIFFYCTWQKNEYNFNQLSLWKSYSVKCFDERKMSWIVLLYKICFLFFKNLKTILSNIYAILKRDETLNFAFVFFLFHNIYCTIYYNLPMKYNKT